MMENDIKNPKDIQELSDDELENAAGGGLFYLDPSWFGPGTFSPGLHVEW
mgnify:CR=1 FL=1